MIALDAHNSIDHSLSLYAGFEVTIGTNLCLIRKFKASYQLCAKTVRGKKLIKNNDKKN